MLLVTKTMNPALFKMIRVLTVVILGLTMGCRTPPDKVPCTYGNHEWGPWQVDTNHYYAEGGYGFYRVETRECLKCHLVVARKIIPE
jgi:hypothetical protein